MSLRLWLPLTGHSQNCGNQQATVTESGVTYSTDGVKFAGSSSSYIKITNDNLLATNLTKGFTISCKVKLTTTAGNQCIFCKRNSTGAGIAIFFIANELRFDVGNSSYTIAPTFTTGQWYDLVFFFRGGSSTTNRQVYVDGIPADIKANITVTAGALNTTLTNAKYAVIGGSANATSDATPAPNNNASFYLKDFRFYDEIIPIVDYPLNDYSCFATTNLYGLPLLTDFTTQPAWDQANHVGAKQPSSGFSNGYNGGVTDPSTGYHACWVLEDGFPTIKFQDLNTTHRWLGISRSGIPSSNFVGKQYTISFDAKATVDGMIIRSGLYYCKSGSTTYEFGNGQKDITISTNWQRYSYTWPATSDINTDKTATFYLYGHNSMVQGTSYVRNIQLEIGSGPTEYTTSSRPAAAVKSVTPFSKNLTINGTISGTKDEVGYLFNGTDSALYNSTGLGLAGKDKTVSFWVKTASDWTWTTAAPWKVIFSDKTSNMACGFYYNTERRFICSTTSTATFSEGGFYKTNEWNHIAIIYSGDSPVACYLNNHSLTTKANNSWTTTGGFAIGCRYNSGLTGYTDCQIKNFKVFDYQLNAAAVESLYSAASVSAKGQIFSNNFLEGTSIKFKQSGIINSSLFVEYPILSTMKIATFGDATWARIYWLDLTSDTTCFNNTTVYDYDGSNRFSKMQYIEQFMNSDQQYEFLLRYPRLSTTDYNRWVQKASPNTAATGSDVAGYAAIGTLAWTEKFGHGIRLTSSSYSSNAIWTISNGNNWWSPIGQKALYNGGMPAANNTSQTETELWVRIDNLSPMKIKNDKSIMGFEFIER